MERHSALVPTIPAWLSGFGAAAGTAAPHGARAFSSCLPERSKIAFLEIDFCPFHLAHFAGPLKQMGRGPKGIQHGRITLIILDCA